MTTKLVIYEVIDLRIFSRDTNPYIITCTHNCIAWKICDGNIIVTNMTNVVARWLSYKRYIFLDDLKSFDPFIKLFMDGSHGQMNSTSKLLKYVGGVVSTNESQIVKIVQDFLWK